jgi:hypothetical protein
MRNLFQALRNPVVIAIVVGLAASGHAATTIFRDGKTLLPVVVAVDADPDERVAALELVRVLGIMSGGKWPMQVECGAGEKGFYVGRTRAAGRLRSPIKLADDLLMRKAGELGPDGFRIWTQDGSVYIEGATPEAVGYAVAWFLQREAGVRWYAPGEKGEVIPRRADWSLPDLDLVREPAYVSREITGLDTPEDKEWARHNGLRGRLEYSHALGHIFSRAELAAKPEWRPQLNGQRYMPKSGDDCYWQPNIALPELAEYVAKVASAAFALDPRRPSFSLGINDTVRFDQSADTRKRVEPLRYFRGKPDYSPLVFAFMNRAAESLNRTNPGHYLGCLAYFWCENPPPFPVDSSVVPYVTTDRTQYYDAGYRAADLDLMARWGASGVRAFGLWEYAEGSNFLVPRVPHHALAEAVTEGWRRGARGYQAEVGPQWGFDEFKVWILAQLVWEPERPYAELADDFFSGYYGPAAGPMHRFFERCEAQWMAQPGPPYWLKYYQQEDQALLFPVAVCQELRALLDQAKSMATTDRIVLARVERTSRAFAVTESYVAFDAARRKLAVIAKDEKSSLHDEEGVIAETVRTLVQSRTELDAAVATARGGESPMATRAMLSPFVRNDPVPRLLWLAGRCDPKAAARLLERAGPGAAGQPSWRALADALSDGDLLGAKELVSNGAFKVPAEHGQEPRFLYPRSGDNPAAWEVRAMPTETGLVTLTAAADNECPHRLRIEGAWDTQVYQWLPAEPGRCYVATAELRGESSPGNDSALFLTFLSAEGVPVGVHRMQSLPKGSTPAWRSAALADIAPPDAAWVGVGCGASRQMAPDWFEVGSISLRGLKTNARP